MAPATYTLKRGDNIWSLANGNYGADYRAAIPGNTTNAKVDYLIRLNNIQNTRAMPIGYVVRLNENATSSTPSSSAATTNNAKKVTITNLGLQCESDTGRDFFADWTWDKHGTQTKQYKVRWEWDVPTSDKPKYEETTTEVTWSDFTIPTEYQRSANWVQVFVIPVANTYKSTQTVTGSDGKPKEEEIDVPYWKENEVIETGKQYHFSSNPPRKPNSKPSITINKETLMLTATIDVTADDLDAYGVAFNVVQDNSVDLGVSNPVKINNELSNSVTFQYPVTTGHTYTVRARTTNEANTLVSGWTDFSNEAGTQPAAPSGLTVRRDTHVDPNNQTKTYSVFLEWTPVGNVAEGTTYKVEYTTDKEQFNITGGNIKPAPTEGSTPSIRIGISPEDLGYTYYFRVKAVNSDGESEPSAIVELPIGIPPGPPTTWSTSNSAFVDETTYRYVEINGETVKIVDNTPMELNWIHNPTDNSKQTFAEIQFNFNDEKDSDENFVWNSIDPLLINETSLNDSEEKVRNHTYGTAVIGTSVSYKGTLYFKLDTNHDDLKNKKIRWRVRTAGVTDILANDAWSVERTIYIYEKPELGLSMSRDPSGLDLGSNEPTHTFMSFPFYIRGHLSLNQEDYTVQKPVGYHVQIVSKNYYVTVDDVGRTKTVNPGDAVYSKYFDTNENPLIVQLSADNIDLESSIDYVVQCTANMSTGLAVTNSYEFNVNWVDVTYAINADVSIDKNSYTALITPYCCEKIPVPGGKNLLKYPYARTNITVDGVDFIDNGDGSVTINGTATNRAIFLLQDIDGDYTGTYTVSGGISDIIKVSCEAWTQENVWVKDDTDNDDFSSTITTVNNKLKVFIDVPSGTTVENVTVYPQLELGSEATEYEEYWETYKDGGLIKDVPLTLAVYRREYDGTYKKIASGIPNNYTSVTDPHPALDYARYRFTATNPTTGALSYWDMAGVPVNGGAVIIQWDEEWSTFDVGSSTSIEGPSWTGSLLRLPYNIKTTDNRKRDKTLVKYAGREHPVSYYGTHLSESSKWSVDIPAYDKETIYALRRLSLWSGDVYVREPSGMGFWANIEVSFNQSYDDLKIPVSFNVTRVEGGV